MKLAFYYYGTTTVNLCDSRSLLVTVICKMIFEKIIEPIWTGADFGRNWNSVYR